MIRCNPSSLARAALVGILMSVGAQGATAQTWSGSAADDPASVSFRQCRIGASKAMAACAIAVSSEDNALVLTIGETTVTCAAGARNFVLQATTLSRTPVTRGNGSSTSLDCGGAKVMFTRVFQIDVNRPEDVLTISSGAVALAVAGADDDSPGEGAVMIRMSPSETSRLLMALNANIK